MGEDKNSYRNITKAIGLFGGTKVFQMLISIIKNKFVAVLLGPNGMGIVGMITSTTSTIAAFTGFGLQTSAVRDISQSYSSGNQDRINTMVTVLRKLILITGMLGMVVTFCLSSYLSQWAFSNNDYALSFKIVSVVLFFDQLCIGQTVLLTGTFHYKYIAKSALYGSIVGLFVTVPMYYLWGKEAIVPVIILTSLFNLLFNWYYSRKITYKKVQLSIKQIFIKGKIMISLGVSIALSSVVCMGQTYLLRLYISNYGNLADVGLYTAGISIATSYIGVVLSAMSSDYSPRLASVANDNNILTETINKQIVLLITILSPIIMLFVVFIKQVTILLYSTQFVAITNMIEWIMYGMFFRAISWCISFSMIAKGDAKIFFINEMLSSCYSLLFSILGYKYGGFTGLGIAFCATYVCYSIQMFLLVRKRFGFSFSLDFFKIVLPLIGLCSIFFVMIKLVGYNWCRYVLGSISIAIVCLITYYYLNKMMDIKGLIVSLKNKIIKG